MQSVAPLLMTREIRGATGHKRSWPTIPRVLFAWAQPPDQDDVPWRAHLQALVAALRPWTGRLIPELDADAPTKSLKRYFTMLPQASLADISNACAATAYTHVHILAHGGRQEDTEHERFAVLLRNTMSDGPSSDRVSAERLATALTGQLAAPDENGARFSCPAVVTLGTCDSGNLGSVTLPGSSLVHTLHAAGIPLVVGSLFPLSKAGSVILTSTLYSSLLVGDDPRVALHRTRQALRTADIDTHDWASMVAYASFSESLDADALRASYVAASKSIYTLNSQIETLASKSELSAEISERHLGELIADLEGAASRLPTTNGYEIEGNGLLGSKAKRKAQALFLIARSSTESDLGDRSQRYLDQSYDLLVEAGRYYRRAASTRLPASGGWKQGAPHCVLTQALSIDAVLGIPPNFQHWSQARNIAGFDLDGTAVDVAWAHGSLLELYLLRAFVIDDVQSREFPWQRAQDNAHESAQKVAEAVRLDAFIVESTLRQIDRYVSGGPTTFGSNKSRRRGHATVTHGNALSRWPTRCATSSAEPRLTEKTPSSQ